jgi:hypothetical protein
LTACSALPALTNSWIWRRLSPLFRETASIPAPRAQRESREWHLRHKGVVHRARAHARVVGVCHKMLSRKSSIRSEG